MRIFLTGGSGFIGDHFIQKAINKNYFIYCVSRKKKNKNYKNVKWLIGNINQDWSKYFKKIDILVHLASTGLEKNFENDNYVNFDFNVLKSYSMILNALNNKCKKFLICSTSSEYSNNGKCKNISSKLGINSKIEPSNAYATSKIIFTNLIRNLSKNYNAKFRIMRIFPTYGNGERNNRLYSLLKNKAKNGENLYIKNPLEFRDFNKIDFVASSLVDACTFTKKDQNFKIFHLSSNRVLSIKQFAIYYWKYFGAKGRLSFCNKTKKTFRHISNKKSTWKTFNESRKK